MNYASVSDLQSRMTRTLSESEKTVADTLLDDAGALIDTVAERASVEAKRIVSCRMVMRALGDGTPSGTPMGASQGSMSGLGYSQSWTMGSGGSLGELYLGKADRQLLGIGNRIGSYSPVEEIAGVTP